MKIEHISGDLLSFPNGITIIIHGCNSKNIMGAGLAFKIKEKWPQVYSADTKAFLSGKAKLGHFSFCKVPAGIVINLYTQEKLGYGRQLNYEALYSGLERLKERLISSRLDHHIGFSEIGCGLAGGDLNIVISMIRSVFESTNFKVTMVHHEG